MTRKATFLPAAALPLLAALGALPTAVFAQPLPPLPQVADEQTVPPSEVDAILESMKLEPLTRPWRRGLTYLVRAADRFGREVQVTIDAQFGEVLSVRPILRMEEAVVDAPMRARRSLFPPWPWSDDEQAPQGDVVQPLPPPPPTRRSATGAAPGPRVIYGTDARRQRQPDAPRSERQVYAAPDSAPSWHPPTVRHRSRPARARHTVIPAKPPLPPVRPVAEKSARVTPAPVAASAPVAAKPASPPPAAKPNPPQAVNPPVNPLY